MYEWLVRWSVYHIGVEERCVEEYKSLLGYILISLKTPQNLIFPWGLTTISIQEALPIFAGIIQIK